MFADRTHDRTAAKGSWPSRARGLVAFTVVFALAAGTAGARSGTPRAGSGGASNGVTSPAVRSAITPAERAAIHASLAFVRESQGRREAFLTSLSEGAAAESPLLEADPGASGDEVVSTYPAAVTRDGSAIAVLRVVERGSAHLESLLVRDRGAAARAVAPPARSLRSPAFSPDGTRIAFESDAVSFRDLFVVARARAAGGATDRAPAHLTDDPSGSYEPSWFDDGQSVAFTTSRDGNAEIYRARADGTNARRLTTSSGDDLTPKVSPDGRRIAFLSARTGVDRVFVMDADGGAQRPVRPSSEGGRSPETEREHTWSPDGRQLAFVGCGGQGKKSRILVWSAERGTTAAVTDGSAVDDMPAFSPDGRYLAFVSDRGGHPDLWLMRADGSGAARIAPESGIRWLPVWVPGAAR